MGEISFRERALTLDVCCVGGLPGNEMGAEGATKVAKVIAANSTLEEVYFNSEHLSFDACSDRH